MYYGEIKNCDIANGTGVRVSLFVSGCTNHCKNCFQPQTWAFDYGEPFTEETENKLIKLLGRDYICGLTVLGGEPFEPSNQEIIYPLLKKVKAVYPNKSVWIYSGFTFEELTDLKDISLKFRGSSNQRIIDLKQTLKENTVIIKEL